jgi:hypothetical protein
VNGKKIYKYFGCCTFKAARKAKQISPASKNKWSDDWPRFWFYHKVPKVEKKVGGRIKECYPLAAKMRKDEFDCTPSLVDTKNSQSCVKAYNLTASLQCCRDLVEEYIAARTWPLKKGWNFVRYHDKTV